MIAALKNICIVVTACCGFLLPTIALSTQPEAAHSNGKQEYIKPFGFQDKIALSLGLYNSSYLACLAALPITLYAYNPKWANLSLMALGTIITSSLIASIGSHLLALRLPTALNEWQLTTSKISKDKSKIASLNAAIPDPQKLQGLPSTTILPHPQKLHDIQKTTRNFLKSTRGKALYYVGLTLPVGIGALLFYALNIPSHIHRLMDYCVDTPNRFILNASANFSPEHLQELNGNLSLIKHQKSTTQSLAFRNSIIPLYPCAAHQPMPSLTVEHFSAITHFSRLPLDLIQCITEYLDAPSMLNLRSTSKPWNQYVHWILKKDPTMLDSMTRRVLLNPGHVRYTPDNFFELELNTTLRSDLSKSAISTYSKSLPTNSQPLHRGRVYVPLDPQNNTQEIIFSHFMKQLGMHSAQDIKGLFLRANLTLIRDRNMPPSPHRPFDIIAGHLETLFQKYTRKIILPPIFERLTIDTPHPVSRDYEMDLIDCVLSFFHPECNFNTLELSNHLLASPTYLSILQYALSKTTLNNVQKIKNLRILIEERVSPFVNIHRDSLKEFFNSFQKVELQVICSQKPSENTKFLKCPDLDLLQCFDNNPKHHDLSIFIHYPHIPDGESHNYKIDLSTLYRVRHSLKNIKVISKLTAPSEFIKMFQSMRTSAPMVSVGQLKTFTLCLPDGLEMQKIEWN